MKILATMLILMLTFSVVASSSQYVFAADDKKIKSSQGSLVKTANNKIQTLQVSLTKTPNKSVVLSGTSVTFTFVIKNTGTEGIICTSLLDDKLGQILSGPTIIIPGATKTFMKSATLFSTTTNSAFLTCANNAGQGVTASASATVTVVNPAVTITKSVTKTKVVKGQQVTYSYKVMNTGDVNVQNCQVNDSVLGNIGAPFNLAIGAMNTVMTTVPINSDVTNTATVTCDVPTTMPSTTNALSNQVTVMIVNPAVTIAKSVSKTKVIAGQQVTYSYKVTNTGDVALTNCNIDDSILGSVGTVNFGLGVGGMTTETTMTAINSQVTNDATVTCDEPQSMTTTSATSNQVTVMIASPAVTIEKSVDQTMVSPGTLVTYSYKVTNTGDVSIEDCQVNDSVLGNISTPFNLALGAMNTVTDQVQIFNDVTNKATVTCNEPQSMNPVTAMSNQVTVTIKLTSSVDLIKTASPNPVEAGETVTYTFDVTNNGQTNLSMCNIVDDKLGPIGDADFSLVVGQSKTFLSSTSIFVDTKNTAQVVCLDPNNQPVGDTAMEQVIVLVVGGDYLPIDVTALLVAGAQTNSVWILSALAVIGSVTFGALYFNVKRD